jgi:hypothetical protein
MNEQIESKNCFACQSKIPETARICSYCSTIQNRLIWRLQRIGTTIGVLSAALAFMSYIVASFPAIRQTLMWRDDVSILSYSDGPIAIANIGDGEVYVSHIFIDIPELGFEVVREVNHTVEPGKILTMDLGQPAHNRFVVARDFPENSWYMKINRGFFGDDCYGFEFLSKTSPRFLFNFQDGRNQAYVSGVGTVYFYSSRKGQIKSEFEVVAVALESQSPECAE